MEVSIHQYLVFGVFFRGSIKSRAFWDPKRPGRGTGRPRRGSASAGRAGRGGPGDHGDHGGRGVQGVQRGRVQAGELSHAVMGGIYYNMGIYG